ncbi:hypothetical protein [Anaerosacchariphilus polymeriproducens]|nr:hypothetical protein [Anaerosacchariphilus polymeriproducens]
MKKILKTISAICMAFIICSNSVSAESITTFGDMTQIINADNMQYAPQLMEFATVLQVGFEKEDLKYDFAKLIQTVKSDPSKTMAVVGTLNHTINKSSANYVEMSDAVSNVLLNVLKCKLTPESKNIFANAIKECFEAPQNNKSGYSFIYSKESENNCTYKCNVLFAIKDQTTGVFMYGLPISLTISLNKSKQKVFGITVKDKQNYSVKVEAVEVLKLAQKVG